MEYCEKINNCIELINTIPEYYKYKKEILANTELNDLSKECLKFIMNHQDQNKNNEEMKEYISKIFAK